MAQPSSRVSRTFSQLTNDIEHAADEYEYFKTNEKFSNDYVESLINKLLENEIIPDLLISILSQMSSNQDEDNEEYNSGSFLPSDLYISNTSGNHVLPMRLGIDGNELVSDNLLHNFIRLPTTENRKKLSPYVISPVQRFENSYYKPKSPDHVVFDSPKPLKEYKVADLRAISRNSLKPISGSSRRSHEFSSREKSNLSTTSKPDGTSVLNSLTEDFIYKSIRSDIMPRVAIDTIASATNEERKKHYSYFTDSLEKYDPEAAKELVQTGKIKLDDLRKNNEELFNTDFLYDLEYKSKFNSRTRPTESLLQKANFQMSKGRINDRFILAPIDSKYDNDKNKTNNIEDLFSTDFLDSFEIKTKSPSKSRLRKFN